MKDLSYSDLASLISAFSNIILTIGLIIAAKTVSLQKKVHFIDIHNDFQKKIRDLQIKMPHDINTRISLTNEERKIVKMYWYTVFDEWIICCRVLGKNDPRFMKLWMSFMWGAKSAIDHIPTFSSELVYLEETKPYLLGTHNDFFEDIRRHSREYNQKMGISKNCILIFGVPCAGKTSTAMEILKSRDNYISIDDIMRNFCANPSISDYVENSTDACISIFRSILLTKGELIAVELGCLFPIRSQEHLRKMLSYAGFNSISFVISIKKETAKERAELRNTDINMGRSDAVKIDNIENMDIFFNKMEENYPRDAIEISGDVSNQERSHLIMQKARKFIQHII